MNLPGHTLNRPAWTCSCDDDRWPCQEAREQLVRDHDRVGLSMHMADLLVLAARELPDVKPDELFDRFLAWTR